MLSLLVALPFIGVAFGQCGNEYDHSTHSFWSSTEANSLSVSGICDVDCTSGSPTRDCQGGSWGSISGSCSGCSDHPDDNLRAWIVDGSSITLNGDILIKVKTQSSTCSSSLQDPRMGEVSWNKKCDLFAYEGETITLELWEDEGTLKKKETMTTILNATQFSNPLFFEEKMSYVFTVGTVGISWLWRNKCPSMYDVEARATWQEETVNTAITYGSCDDECTGSPTRYCGLAGWGPVSNPCVCSLPLPPFDSLQTEVISSVDEMDSVTSQFLVKLEGKYNTCVTSLKLATSNPIWNELCTNYVHLNDSLTIQLFDVLDSEQELLVGQEQIVFSPTMDTLNSYGSNVGFGPVLTFNLLDVQLNLRMRFASQCAHVYDLETRTNWPSSWIGEIVHSVCETDCMGSAARECQTGGEWGPITGNCSCTFPLPDASALRTRIVEGRKWENTDEISVSVVGPYDSCSSSATEAPNPSWDQICSNRVTINQTINIQVWGIDSDTARPFQPLLLGQVEVRLGVDDLRLYGDINFEGPVITYSFGEPSLEVQFQFISRCEAFYDEANRVHMPWTWIGENATGTCNSGCMGTVLPRFCQYNGLWAPLSGSCLPCPPLPREDVLKIRFISATEFQGFEFDLSVQVSTETEACVTGIENPMNPNWQTICSLGYNLGEEIFFQVFENFPTGYSFPTNIIEVINIPFNDTTLYEFGANGIYSPDYF
eukprot:Lithocolla_globosa_v1_NODE_5_length_12010_cov_23.451945.p2 type:complete len:712 gc:universal NODE_5_length_12010_cov_23.451945:10588-8453(-)